MSRHHQIKLVTITKGLVQNKRKSTENNLSSTLGATSLPFLCSTTLRGVGYGMARNYQRLTVKNNHFKETTQKLASKLQFLQKGASGTPEIPWKKW